MAEAHLPLVKVNDSLRKSTYSQSSSTIGNQKHNRAFPDILQGLVEKYPVFVKKRSGGRQGHLQNVAFASRFRPVLHMQL